MCEIARSPARRRIAKAKAPGSVDCFCRADCEGDTQPTYRHTYCDRHAPVGIQSPHVAVPCGCAKAVVGSSRTTQS